MGKCKSKNVRVGDRFVVDTSGYSLSELHPLLCDGDVWVVLHEEIRGVYRMRNLRTGFERSWTLQMPPDWNMCDILRRE